MTGPVRAARAADLPAIAALLESSGLPVAGVAQHLESFEVAGEGEATAVLMTRELTVGRAPGP